MRLMPESKEQAKGIPCVSNFSQLGEKYAMDSCIIFHQNLQFIVFAKTTVPIRKQRKISAEIFTHLMQQRVMVSVTLKTFIFSWIKLNFNHFEIHSISQLHLKKINNWVPSSFIGLY